MHCFAKRGLILVLFCSCFILKLFSGTYYIEWNTGELFADESFVRYRINNQKWIDMEDSLNPIQSVVYGKNNKISFETSLDSETWSEPFSVSLKVCDPEPENKYQLKWTWNEIPGAKAVRYKTNNGEWIYSSPLENTFSDAIIPNTLIQTTVQTSVDGVTWLEGKSSGIIVAESREIPKTRNMTVSLTGSVFWGDVYFPSSKTSLRSGLGFGGNAILFIPVSNTWGFTLNNQLSYYRLGVFNYLEFDPSLNIRLGYYSEKGPALFCSFGAGASIVKRDSSIYCYPSLNLGLGLDIWLMKSLAFTIRTDALVSIQTEKLLNPDSYIDSVSFNATGSVGLTYAFCSKGENDR